MPERTRERILVVEDDDAMAKVLTAILESVNYEVHVESSGRGAIGFAAETPVQLVILDLRLPDLNGYEVCKAIRQFSNSWTLPILMLTGMHKPVDQLRGFAFGADAYMVKPCDPDEILRTISTLMGKRPVNPA